MAEPSRRERFEASVLVHLHAGYNLARWILHDEHAAQDAVQDASLRALRYFDTMHGAAPKAWFMAIVRNACLDWLTHNARHDNEESFDAATHDFAALDAQGRVESPESIALLGAELRRLNACLAALPREFREVLILREMEELSYRDIGAIVGVPIGTVMSRLSRGRDRLTEMMHLADKRMSS